jgi:hypothetical protein
MSHKNLILVTTLFIIVGCAPIMQKPDTVFIPVAAPKAILPQRPILALDSITDEMPINEVIRSYAMSVSALVGYSKELEAICK